MFLSNVWAPVLALSAGVGGQEARPVAAHPGGSTAVPCTGTPADRGHLLREAVEQAPPNWLVELGACDYELGPRPGGTSGIIIANQSLEIAGLGPASRVRLLHPIELGLEIRSGARDILIRDLSIQGAVQRTQPDGTVVPGRMQAIGSYSGQSGIRNIRITRVEVLDVTVGISVGSPHDRKCVPGRYVQAEVTYNHVHETRGTIQGTGYAIHSECSERTIIRGNLIERAERHSIYQARTSAPALTEPDDVLIEGNTITEHSPFWRCDRTHRAALVVARSHNVRITHNLIVHSYQDGISVERDLAIPDAAPQNIAVVENRFVRGADRQRRDRCGSDIWVNAPGALVSIRGNVGADPFETGRQLTNTAASVELTAGEVNLSGLAIPHGDRDPGFGP